MIFRPFLIFYVCVCFPASAVVTFVGDTHRKGLKNQIKNLGEKMRGDSEGERFTGEQPL